MDKIAGAAERAGLLWEILRQGGNHTLYRLDGVTVPIARHNDLDEYYAVRVYKQCEAKLGKGWWRA